MNEGIHLLNEIDRYLNGEMDGQELAAFEQLRLQDSGFGAKVEEQLEFRKILRNYGERRELREQLSRIAAVIPPSLSEPELHEQAGIPAIRPVRVLWTSIAAAATVALLIAGASLWFSGYFRPDDSVRYRELKRDLDYIKRSQNAIINDMKTSKAPVNPGKFGGTGFILSPDGYMATNYHVIENSDSIYVQDDRGNAYKAKLVFQDPATDLAILKILDSTFRMPEPPYSISNHPADLGEEVYTLGYPKDNIVYGKGYISAETGFRDDTSSYQVTLNVNPGNSGGPLLDNRGNIVGIVSGKQTPSMDIAFAVKSSCLEPLLDSLSQVDSVKINYLPARTGVLYRLNRVDQIRKMEDYIFVVKVYN
ncbi:MAG TPA: trypsin-like peptidase domain-containing protein [Chitinophagaceae bacterium]|nr:trypsin-like peptidase domain-containing protein [Chitinophagaceae bacterium]